MLYRRSGFEQLLEPLNRRELNRIVEQHDGDHAVGSGPRGWTCIRHLKALLFAQVMGLGSLREIEQGLAAYPGGLYHLDLRVPCRSTLSDAQAARPVAVFRDICLSLMAQASRAIRREANDLVQHRRCLANPVTRSAVRLGRSGCPGPRPQASSGL